MARSLPELRAARARAISSCGDDARRDLSGAGAAGPDEATARAAAARWRPAPARIGGCALASCLMPRPAPLPVHDRGCMQHRTSMTTSVAQTSSASRHHEHAAQASPPCPPSAGSLSAALHFLAAKLTSLVGRGMIYSRRERGVGGWALISHKMRWSIARRGEVGLVEGLGGCTDKARAGGGHGPLGRRRGERNNWGRVASNGRSVRDSFDSINRDG